MKSKRHITVLMCVYNGEDFLSEAIDSILKQSFVDFEFIIINDCSTDSTRTILEKYTVADNRLKVLYNKSNLGLTKSLNIGLNIAQGEFIARIDADDVAYRDRLKRQYNFLVEHKDIVLVGSAMSYIDEKGYEGKALRFPFSHNCLNKRLIHLGAVFPHSSVMFRKKQILDIGGYCVFFKKSQDRDLFIRVSEKYKIACLKDVLVKWRERHDSLTFQDNGYSQFIYGFVAMICHYLRKEDIEISHVQLIKIYGQVVAFFNDVQFINKKKKLDSFIINLKHKHFFEKIIMSFIFAVKNIDCYAMLIRKKVGYLQFDPLVRNIINRSLKV